MARAVDVGVTHQRCFARELRHNCLAFVAETVVIGGRISALRPPHSPFGTFRLRIPNSLDIVKGLHTVHRDHQITRGAGQHRGGIPEI